VVYNVLSACSCSYSNLVRNVLASKSQCKARQAMAATYWGPVVSVLLIALANLVAWAANENSWIFQRCLKPLGVRPLLFISNRYGVLQLHTSCA
jgi:hypothetical protein